MCLQTLHLCLPHGLLHSGSLSVMVFLIRILRRFGGVYWRLNKYTSNLPIIFQNAVNRFNALDEKIDFRTEFSD